MIVRVSSFAVAESCISYVCVCVRVCVCVCVRVRVRAREGRRLRVWARVWPGSVRVSSKV